MAELTRSYCTLVILLASVGWCQRPNHGDGRQICLHCDWQLFCNCSSSEYSRVPKVTDLALSLDLAFNNITEVTDDDFMGHKKLEALSLQSKTKLRPNFITLCLTIWWICTLWPIKSFSSDNRLTVIHPAAFDSLLNLEELNLSNNQLTALHYSWFQKLEALQRLNLLHNPYR